MSEIKIPWPESLNAVYLIPVQKAPKDPKTLFLANMDKHLTGFIHELVLRVAPTPIMRLGTYDPSKFPHISLPILALLGASKEELKLVEEAKKYVLVQVSYLPGWPPVHEFVGRAVAAVLAAELGSVVIDEFTPKVESVKKALDSLPDEHGAIILSNWLCVPHSPAKNGCWFTTKGLARFGLPELQTIDVPVVLTRSWVSVMTGLAYALMAHVMKGNEPGEIMPTEIRIQDTFELTADDIAAAYGTVSPNDESEKIDDSESDDEQLGKTEIRLSYEPAEGNERNYFLTILPPEGDERSFGEFMAGVYHDLFGADESEIKLAPMSDKMTEAISTALSQLEDARERFINKQLPFDVSLLVKHAVADEESVEYVWTFVNDWSSPEFLLGTCANDANIDPNVRMGRPIRVATDDVVDWALYRDGEIVEGGWTQEVVLSEAR